MRLSSFGDRWLLTSGLHRGTPERTSRHRDRVPSRSAGLVPRPTGSPTSSGSSPTTGPATKRQRSPMCLPAPDTSASRPTPRGTTANRALQPNARRRTPLRPDLVSEDERRGDRNLEPALTTTTVRTAPRTGSRRRRWCRCASTTFWPHTARRFAGAPSTSDRQSAPVKVRNSKVVHNRARHPQLIISRWR